ncbi:MAG TPA: M50 family metallopeptidase [Myxococcota bacterium]|nr:M50 family metallopeptidase [Myxococcota bacterium]
MHEYLVSVGEFVVGGQLGQAVLAVLVVMAGSWIALLCHELGHATAAGLVGVRIWGIRLGMGPVLWRGIIGGCRVHLALLPFLGAVHLLDEDACAIGYRDIVAGRWRFEWGPQAWRAPIISAAGGLFNLMGVLALAAWWEHAGRPALGTWTGDLLLFAIASNIAGYLNLLPCFHSDGSHLLAHLRAARFRFQPAA